MADLAPMPIAGAVKKVNHVAVLILTSGAHTSFNHEPQETLARHRHGVLLHEIKTNAAR